jgi:hypothetical protein
VQVLCPTGNSANLVSGVTLHSFLKIPTTSKATKEMVAPDGPSGEKLQQNCDGIVALLVDERSLIGCSLLGWTEFMCRYGMNRGNNSSKPWGNIPVVVFLGDDVQLPPVCDSPVYNCKSTIPAAIHGSLIWKDFNQAVTLTTIIRQDNDQQQLKNTLLSMREYTTTKEQAMWLQNFQWNRLKTSHGPELMQRMLTTGLFVFPNHAAEWEHNKLQILEANKLSPIAKLTAIKQGLHSSSSSTKCGSLVPTLYLCRGAQVMLTVNLNVAFGLFNGSMGKVIDILYLHDGPPNSLPDVVMVDFPKYTGPPFLQSHPQIVPIVPVERNLECYCYNCKIKQIPLRLGWGTTIHRCQGMTVGKGQNNRYIVIHPGTTTFESKNPGALFVALSRAKSAGGNGEDPDLAWHPNVLVNEERLYT